MLTEDVALFVKSEIERWSIPEPNSGCWLWMRSLSGQTGRAQWMRFGENLAYRLAYRAYKGPIPAGLGVLHSCDNPACVNPDHLSPGTQKDNMRQCSERGRVRGGFRGKRHPGIGDAQAAEISRRLGNGERVRDLAIEIGVCKNTIYNASIRNRGGS